MTTVGDAIVAFAREQIGDPYVWGAEGPNSFDCSGLVYAAYKAAGLDVSRTTAATLGRQGEAVDLARAVPGDVLYYDNPGATDHVGIYIGNGQMIEAPTAGEKVKVSGIRTPTSIRRIHQAVNKGYAGDITVPFGERIERTLEAVNPFSGWQADVVDIGLKIMAAGACVALVVVGAREALKDKGTQ